MSLYEAPSMLIAHAHPDDETIATGALLAHRARRGVVTHVLTATRGERGEVVPGAIGGVVTPGRLQRHRAAELSRALEVLGVSSSVLLGSPPARAHGLAPRHYRDSGMRWITPEVAGPAGIDDPEAFSLADADEAADDLLTWVEQIRPDLLVSYDRHGGYGHPDHVRMHEVTREVARRSGIPMAELVHDPRAAHDHWFALSHEYETLRTALRQHASQLTVQGDEVIHVGGQRDPIQTDVGLRLVELRPAPHPSGRRGGELEGDLAGDAVATDADGELLTHRL